MLDDFKAQSERTRDLVLGASQEMTHSMVAAAVEASGATILETQQDLQTSLLDRFSSTVERYDDIAQKRFAENSATHRSEFRNSIRAARDDATDKDELGGFEACECFLPRVERLANQMHPDTSPCAEHRPLRVATHLESVNPPASH